MWTCLSGGRARFCAGIWRCVVGVGWVILSAIEEVDLFLFMRGRGRVWSVYVSDVSLRHSLNPPNASRCSFCFLFFPDLFDTEAAVLSVLVLFVFPALLVAVGVVLHGIFGCSNPDDHMRYAMRWCVCRV